VDGIFGIISTSSFQQQKALENGTLDNAKKILFITEDHIRNHFGFFADSALFAPGQLPSSSLLC